MVTLFTKIIQGEIPSYKIYEDENHFAFLDIAPFEKGHTLVIPKKEYATIFDIPEDEFVELMKVVKKIATHYKEVLGVDINIIQNNGSLAHQEVEHLHFHIIPRKENKKLYALENGVKYLEDEAENFMNRLRLN